MTCLDRFLHYITVETTSSETSGVRPSTPGQKDLARALMEEMTVLGLSAVHMSPADGAVFGTIPANTDKKLPTLGFLAHMDTSCAASGKNVKARIVKNYDGGTIQLSDTVSMSPDSGYDCLRQVVGEDLIVTDGTTLLGADDKAGIAEIMTMAEELLHTDTPHGVVKVAFTTDEEIGAGPDLFDVPAFGCDFGYTVDGGPIGELEYENFNASSARITVHGVGVHPGSAKNLMVNAAAIASEYQCLLPQAMTPEHTQDYEGFIHLDEMQGTVTEANLKYILRDHNLEKLHQKEELMRVTGDFLNAKYGIGTVEVDIRSSYYNMREKIEPCFYIVERAMKAMRAVGMDARTSPVRGGTDGARLSYEGLPCPNLCTGGDNYHGRFEYIPVEDMEKCVEMLISLLTNVE